MTDSDTGIAAGGSQPIARTAMLKPLLIMLVLVALVMAGIFAVQGFKGHMIKKMMLAAAAAPKTVSSAVAAPTSWQGRLQAVGSLRAVRGADLAAQASGVVDQIDFDSGAEVSAGTTLLRLKLNDDPAKLQQLEAAAELTQQNYKRDTEQFEAQAVSQSALDNDLATLKSARAQVAAQQALIEEKIVKAPFAGRLGIRQVDEGQYLSAGATVVTLQALDPILIDFYLPQQALASLKVGQSAAATVDAYPSDRFKGAITSINSRVESASRSVQVRATFPNADHRLVPGMYANVEIDNGQAESLITVPLTAITYNPYGDTVYVVQHGGVDGQGMPKLLVQLRFVTLGATRGDQVAVLSGLAAGEVIVSAGQMKLRNGDAVRINNSVATANETNPTPPNE